MIYTRLKLAFLKYLVVIQMVRMHAIPSIPVIPFHSLPESPRCTQCPYLHECIPVTFLAGCSIDYELKFLPLNGSDTGENIVFSCPDPGTVISQIVVGSSETIHSLRACCSKPVSSAPRSSTFLLTFNILALHLEGAAFF